VNLTVDIINQLFEDEPTRNGRADFAITMPIPIAFFNLYEKEIRSLGTSRNGYKRWRAIYRGPRHDFMRAYTKRKDATHVRMYYK